jgi:hypothetical protein
MRTLGSRVEQTIYIVSKSGRIPNVTTRRQRSKNRGWCTKFVAPSNEIWCAFPQFSFIGLTVFQMFQNKRNSIVAYRRIRPAIEHHWRLLVSILWQLKREGSSRVVKICQNWVGICFGIPRLVDWLCIKMCEFLGQKFWPAHSHTLYRSEMRKA